MKASQKVKIWERTVTTRGGSYTIVIPDKVIEHLDLVPGQQVCLLTIPNKKYAIIGRKENLGLKTTIKLEGNEFEAEVFRSVFTEEDLLELLRAIRRLENS